MRDEAEKENGERSRDLLDLQERDCSGGETLLWMDNHADVGFGCRRVWTGEIVVLVAVVVVVVVVVGSYVVGVKGVSTGPHKDLMLEALFGIHAGLDCRDFLKVVEYSSSVRLVENDLHRIVAYWQ
jgi:hypothetical protein